LPALWEGVVRNGRYQVIDSRIAGDGPAPIRAVWPRMNGW
jgi:hypothetical protein